MHEELSDRCVSTAAIVTEKCGKHNRKYSNRFGFKLTNTFFILCVYFTLVITDRIELNIIIVVYCSSFMQGIKLDRVCYCLLLTLPLPYELCLLSYHYTCLSFFLISLISQESEVSWHGHQRPAMDKSSTDNGWMVNVCKLNSFLLSFRLERL